MTSDRARGLLATMAGVVLGLAALAGAAGAGRMVVLNDQTIWRHHVTFRPPVVGAGGTCAELVVRRNPWVKRGEWLCSPLPEADWASANFDDSGWPRRGGPLFGGYGDYRPAGPALICVRGRFGVRNPARAGKLELALKYRGGAVVYLNGTEFARGHMPKGKITPLTPAADYPRKAFVKPDGRTPLQGYGRRKPPADLMRRYEARIRRLTATVPGSLLRTSTNVLAIELHRSPVPKGLPAMERGSWDTAGLVSATLTAPPGRDVKPNVKAREGIQIWQADVMLRIGHDAGYGDPFEPTGAVRLTAPRNGTACGQVVVSTPSPVAALSGRVGALRGPGGRSIPAGAVSIRYPQIGKSFIPLLEKPPGDAAVQPIWLTASVPAAAAPGTYHGSLIIAGLPKTAAIPVELTVVDWKAPDPGNWRTVVNMLQSPESVAGHYKVPLWSDEHFKLLAPSLRLMGQMGNDVVGISAVAKSVFGNDPLVLFRKVGGKYVPDVTLAERYLKLYDKHAGQPMFLSVNVWSYGMYHKGWGRDGGKAKQRGDVIPVAELRNGKRATIELPIYGRPGTEELWRAVMDALSASVKKLGWNRTRILLGTSGDTWPSEETIALFRKVAPGVQWRVLTHGGGAPRWGVSDYERTQLNGMTVGYLEIARRIRSGRVHVAEHPVTCNARDLVRADPFHLRALPITNTISSNFDGFCWKGIDYWDYLTPEGKRRSALNTYVHFGNMVGSTPRTLAVPGPKGAVSTVQLEMLRQGTQDCEAVLSIRRNLRTLYARPGRKFDVVHLCLEGALSGVRRRDGSTVPTTPRRDLLLRLLYPAGTGPKGKAPADVLSRTLFFNSGRHTLSFKPPAGGAGDGLDFQITIGDDRWSKGGSGRFALRFTRDGKSLTGSFTGSFEGVATKGAVSGSFVPSGFTRPSKTPPVENELTRRCDTVIGELAAVLLTGSRTSPQGGADVERLVRRLYATAAEVARAADTKMKQAGNR